MIFLAIAPLVVFVLVAFLYVWYLRLAAKWTLKTSLNRKIAWLFCGGVIVVSVLVRALLEPAGNPVGIFVSLILHLTFGAMYFGHLAVNESRERPGFFGGLKMTSLAMAMLGLTVAVSTIVPMLLIKHFSV